MDEGSRRGPVLLSVELHIAVHVLLLFSASFVDAKCIMFNFGDSNSDTGGLSAGFGFFLASHAGRRFFYHPTGRFSDGRLYIDFLCDSLKISYLSPYLESSGSNFHHGANFAIAGAATDPNPGPFPLATQVLQFLHFKNRTRQLMSQGLGSMISEHGFQNAVYSIDIGQNDISLAFTANSTYPEVIDRIPSIISRIKDAIQTIYHNGGRKFWIYNTGPLGCLPETLASHKQNNSEIDENGCLAAYNDAAKAFNAELSNFCNYFGSELENSYIVCTDMFSIKYDLFANSSKYGFENPLMACCSQSTGKACNDGSQYISWDGVHYTDAANAIVAMKILSTKYSTPQIKLNSFCQIGV